MPLTSPDPDSLHVAGEEDTTWGLVSITVGLSRVAVTRIGFGSEAHLQSCLAAGEGGSYH